MFLSGLLGKVDVLGRLRSDAALRRLQSQSEFRRLILRERARSDRTGERFCLLAFEPREKRARRRTLGRLALILKRRLRITDDLGWLDHGRVAALLPCTPPEGAWKVADDVCLAFPESEFPPLCTVYVYPEPHEARQQTHDCAPPAGKPIQAMQGLLARATPAWKRTLDVAGAGLGLVVLAPLLAFLALAVKLDSAGPILFRQLRTGHGGRKFRILKFRTMRADADAQKSALQALNEQDGPAFKMRDDPRVTRVGRILRATSLDELPQLWNVLRGEMSLVGPRPLPCHESDASALWHRRRLDVAPGLTGAWQVRGRCQVAFDDWMRMDLRYIARQSLAHDLKLILATVPAVILRRGAH